MFRLPALAASSRCRARGAHGVGTPEIRFDGLSQRPGHNARRAVANVNESYEEELATVVAPVTLLWGERDSVTPVDVATRASAVLTATHTLRLLPGVGHLLPTEAPGDLATTVLGVVRS